MQPLSAPMLLIAMLLAAFAGFVDAIAFSGFAGFFAASMTGNTTRLGVDFAAGFQEAWTAGAVLCGFLSGVMGGAIADRAGGLRGREAVMLLVTVLLAIAALCLSLGPLPVALVLLAGAMGAQNAVFIGSSDGRVGLTYLTGMLVRLGQGLADALMGVGPRFAWVCDLLFWCAFLGGAFGGASIFRAIDDTAVWIAALLAGLLTVLVAVVSRPARRAAPGAHAPRPRGMRDPRI